MWLYPPGLLGTVGTVAKEEGVGALWKGVVPGLHRQVLFGGLRIGLYEPVKNLYVGKDFQGDVPLIKKIAAGLTTGGDLHICRGGVRLSKRFKSTTSTILITCPERHPLLVQALGSSFQSGRCETEAKGSFRRTLQVWHQRP